MSFRLRETNMNDFDLLDKLVLMIEADDFANGKIDMSSWSVKT